jgi:phosphatidyl-myo-inositol dimannoside synthase
MQCNLSNVKQSAFLGAALIESGKGGIAAVARMTARALVDLGAHVDLLSFLDKEAVEVDGVRARPCQGSKLRFALSAHQLLLRNRFAIYDSLGMARVHPHFVGSLRPYAAWIHGIEVWGDMRPDYLQALRRADLVFVNSRYTLERFQSTHGALSTARVCHLATEQNDAPASLADFSGPPVALIVGRVGAGEMKGHLELLASWPDVVSAVPDARLIIAGGGSGLEELRDQVKASPAVGSIDLKGFVPADRLPRLFQAAHVFAMPSQQEGFGVAYVEAMRFGLPAIASRQDAGQEVIEDRVTGYNVDLLQKGELTARLIELLSDPNKCAALGAAGHCVWKERFRFSHFAARFANVWNEFGSAPGGCFR